MKVVISLMLMLLVLSGYVAKLVFTEWREFGRVSLEYYLLTPRVLAQLSGSCEDSPRFIYSSADGPKPTIVHLHCVIDENILVDYLVINNFRLVDNNNYYQGELVGVDFDSSGGNSISRVTVYQ